MKNIVIEQQHAFFEAIAEHLKDLDQNRGENADINLMYSGACDSYKKGMDALVEFEKRIAGLNDREKLKKIYEIARQNRLPSQIYQSLWRQQEQALLQMIDKTFQGQYNPDEVEPFFSIILAFECPTVGQARDSQTGLIFPLVTGVAGYYVGKHL